MTRFRNSESLTLEGEWGPPADQTRRVGTLNFDPERGAELVLLSLGDDQVSPFTEPEVEPTLAGQTVDGQSVSAFDCFPHGFRAQLFGGGSRTAYQSHELLIGAITERREDFAFKRARVYVDGLLEWLTASWATAIRRDPLLWPGRREWIAVQVANGRLLFELGERRSRSPFRETYEREASVRIDVTEPLTLDRWRSEWLRPLVDLVAFGTGTRSEVDALTALMYRDTRGRYHAQPRRGAPARNLREIHVVSRRGALPAARVKGRDFLLPAGVTGHSGFGRLVRGWFTRYRELGGSASTFHGTLNSPHVYLENRLLDLLSFAETYHRRYFDEPTIDRDRRREIAGAVREMLTPDEFEVYGPRLAHGHEQSQRQRVRWLCDRAGGVVESLATMSPTLTAQLIDTRNWLTHWSRKSANVVEDAELLTASDRLIAVLQINLLLDLGIPSRSIEYGVRNAWVFQPDVLRPRA